MKSRSKKALLVVAMCLATAVAFTGCGSDGGAQKQFLNIATGGTAGTYYPLGGLFAELFNKNIPGMNASAVSTGGSVANINMLKEGKAEMAIAQNDIIFYAYNGQEMFKDKKVDNLQGIATLYPETIQIVTLGDSNIKTVADLKGKNVAVGAIGSGVEANARQVLEAYGLTYNDVSPKYLSFGEAASALKDNQIDAAFLTAGAPTAAVQDIAATKAVKLIGIDDEHVKILMDKYPFYAKQEVAPGTYAGFNQKIQTVAVKASLVVSKKVDEKLGYELTKALFNNLEQIRNAHAVGKFITLKSATEAMPIPFNPGAEKYFKENKK